MTFSTELKLSGELIKELRYGENPHQQAALYVDASITRPCVARAKQIQGKELSFNNLADADAAFECVAEFDEPAAVIVKHMNPCGVGIGENVSAAYAKALLCDPVSAFGGIVAINRTVDTSLALELNKLFLEVLIAPAFDSQSLKILATKPNLRVLETGGMPQREAIETTVKSIAGGFLVQTRDNTTIPNGTTVVTKRAPTDAESLDMKFAFAVCKHVKSNAIVYAKNGATLGIGAGQMSRVYSAKIAAMKAKDAHLDLAGSVMASDAFMPFPDCIEEAAQVGATAVIQPGGSKNDQASINSADDANIAMVFTGTRHFRH